VAIASSSKDCPQACSRGSGSYRQANRHRGSVGALITFNFFKFRYLRTGVKLVALLTDEWQIVMFCLHLNLDYKITTGHAIQ